MDLKAHDKKSALIAGAICMVAFFMGGPVGVIVVGAGLWIIS